MEVEREREERKGGQIWSGCKINKKICHMLKNKEIKHIQTHEKNQRNDSKSKISKNEKVQ